MFHDIYEGTLFRPPSEAYSLILQVTIGCSWNRCTFCVAYRGKEFRIKSLKELMKDIDAIYPYYRDTTRIFLADGNALSIPTDDLVEILTLLYSRFRKLERVSIYGGPMDIREKSVQELERLRDAGLDLVYFGLESGSNEVLRRVRKGVTASTMIETTRKVKDAGLPLSVIFILGLGGVELSKIHAEETAKVLNAQDPEYAAALTLMVVPGSDIHKDVRSGNLTPLNPQQSLQELRSIVERLELSNCIFRANHASNYAQIRGTLPWDRQDILDQIDEALAIGNYKPEYFRRL